jgi:hypothetical protein
LCFNGRRLNDVDKSGVNLAMIPLSRWRIEISTAPAPCCSDNAVGGVINIITKAAGAARARPRASRYRTASWRPREPPQCETAAVVSVQGRTPTATAPAANPTIPTVHRDQPPTCWCVTATRRAGHEALACRVS